jgi:hypothetical protein
MWKKKNPANDIEDVNAYDISNFFRRFGEGDSHTTQNDDLRSNSGHIISASDKRKGHDVGHDPN